MLKPSVMRDGVVKRRQRLIFDRRPQNACERRLEWVTLPHAALFVKLLLKQGQEARRFGKDLRSFHFALRHHPEWFGRNATGRPLEQKFVRRWRSACLGKQPFSHHNQHWMVLRVAGMGDQNSVDLSSAAHANLLEPRGLLPVKERLAWDLVRHLY